MSARILKGPCLLLLGTLLWLAGQHALACTLDRLAELPVSMVGMSPLVPASLDGQSVLLLADSGAQVSDLSASAVARLHLALQPAPLMVSLRGIGGVVQTSLVTVQHLMLAGVPVQPTQFLVGGNAPRGAAGNLGQNVLAGADVDYDLPHRVIRLMRPRECGAQPLAYWAGSQVFAEIPLERGHAGMAIGTLYINGTAVRALLDTGASESLLTLAAAARAGIRPDSPGVVPANREVGIDQQRLRTWNAPVADVRIGDEQVRDTHLRIIDADLGGTGALGDVDMLLGADFFLSHHVYVANSQHKAFFTYSGGPVFSSHLPMKTRRNPCLCLPALAVAPDHGPMLGIWTRHQLNFSLYFAPSAHYSSEGLRDLVAFVVTQSGARLNGPVEFAKGAMTLDFSTFLPLTTQNAATVHGIPGAWRPVLFSETHSFGQLHTSDCEVLSQVATLLTLYAVRDLKSYLPCIPNRGDTDLYWLSFQTFVPQDTARSAVGGQ